MAGGCSTVTVMQKNGDLTSRTISDSDILMELVGNYEAYDHRNGNKISVSATAEPAVAHAIGDTVAILDHPAQVMSLHGVSSLKRDPIVILRMDGEDLLEFINSQGFKLVVMSIFTSDHQKADDDGSLITLHDYVLMALNRLTIDHGMPPPLDSWVMSNIIEPALQHCEINRDAKRSISKEETLLEDELKNVAEKIAQLLKEEPVIVAHVRNTFDGSGIKRLLSCKSELDMALDMAKKEGIPIHQIQKQSNKEYLRTALDVLSPITGLPPNGAFDKVDEVVNQVVSRMMNKEDVKIGILEGEKVFKKLIRQMLRRIMFELEANPISISTNFIIHP